MAINFPNSPQLDDTYTEGNRSWRWNGVYWRATSATVGYTGSKGDQGESFRILGSVATVNDLPADSSGLPGDGYIIIDTGDLYVWDGFNWNNNGRIVGYTGSRGVPGASVKLLGSVATEQDLPQNPESGDGYIVQALGDLFVWNGTVWTNVGKITGEVGPIGFTGSKGDVGFTGSTGFVGSRGTDGNFGGVTLDYTFSSNTDSSLDPGTGKIKFNDTVLTSASLMYIGDADDDNINLTSYLATIDASTSELKGHFRISRKGYPEQFVIFAVTDTTQNQGSYFIISCSYVSGGLSDSSTAFDDGDDILITFARTGDKGDTGFTGSQGLQGFSGSQGATGTSVRIVGSLADQSLLPDPYGGEIGDGYLVEDTGHLWLWNGTTWNDIGQLTGEVGPSGFTGSQGLGIIDTELVNDELIIIYDDSTQNNLGNIRGFQGSRGESSFFWGAEPPPNPEVGARWFYTTEGLLLVYTDDGDSQQWVEVAATGFLGQTGFTGSAGLSGVLVQTVTYVAQATAADTQGGETLGIVGGGFNAGIKVYVDSTECAATVVDQNNLTFTSPAKSAGVYDIVVYNTDGSSGTRPQSIEYSGAPVWTTQPSLPEQTTDSAISIILSATSNSSVTYFLQQDSSMPAGLSLSSSGVITGTVTGITEDTVYTFTVVAIDAESQTTPRTFSLTVLVGVSVEYLVVAGGGGGGFSNGGGAGAGGFRTGTGLSVTAGTSYTVTVGAGGTGATTTGATGGAGGNSVFSTITSNGGGGGGVGLSPGPFAGASGGSGGGGASGGAGGTGNSPSTLPSQGSDGGSSSGSAPNYGGGGGGGATGTGVNGTSTAGGNGGDGTASSISGSAITYSGGGGGATFNGGTRGLGGAGGGGNAGAAGTNDAGDAGVANTGCGGGGGASNGPGPYGVGGAGGSGVVILKYSNSFTLVNADGGLTFTTSTAVAGYKITTFTAGTGNIVFYRNSDVIEVEYLVVAGGGGGGGHAGGGGGGGGGFRTSTVSIIPSTNYTVTVGAGGNGGTLNSGVAALNGSSSIFYTVTSAGGGSGCSSGVASGGNGGSGGGGGNGTAGGQGNIPNTVPSQGNNGGNAASLLGGGGGGAGGIGSNAVTSSSAGNGGNGENSSITGSVVPYAGGGGGGAHINYPYGTGGAGGGGEGGQYAASPTSNGVAGTINTGGGGGGAGGRTGVNAGSGGAGGRGVVIIAYPDSHPAITTISAGLVYDQPTRAGYRVYRFTAGTGNVTF